MIANRVSALKSLLETLLQVEDVVKVHEARLTEKETTSLDPRELDNYQSTLKVFTQFDFLSFFDQNLKNRLRIMHLISAPFMSQKKSPCGVTRTI